MQNKNCKQKILVTGGTGYIGSHACVALLDNGFDVVIVDNLSNSQANVVDAIEKISAQKVCFVQADLRDKQAVEQIFQKHHFWAVMHFAGLKAVGESCQKPLLYFDNNVNGSICLLETMQKFDVKRIVFSSSATVYGVPERLPLTEDCRLNVTNPYGATKLTVENILTYLCQSDSSFSATILRYFNPVGAHPSGLIGECPNGVPNNLAPYIVNVAKGKYPHLNVYGKDYDTVDGTGVRDYIDICDLVDGHICALQKCLDSGVHIFNLGTGKGLSVLEMVKAFENATGVKIAYKFQPRRSGDIAMCFADPSKANKQLGWHTTRTVADMMQSLWNFAQKQ